MRGSGSSRGRIAYLARVATSGSLRSDAVESAVMLLSAVFPTFPPPHLFPPGVSMHPPARDARAIQVGSDGMSLFWHISCKSIFGETASQVSSMISCGKGCSQEGSRSNERHREDHTQEVKTLCTLLMLQSLV